MSTTLVCKGSWSPTLAWEFYLSNDLPPLELCTAASCVGIMEPEGKLVLTHTFRGWGCMGGHIEESESVAETMIREALEEGGFRVQEHQLLGYRKVTSTEQITPKQTGRPYPFPTSYIPWFMATSSLPLIPTTGDEGEVFGSRLFTADEVRRLGLEEQPMVDEALKQYRR